ncbi:class II aldolase/adducin family protein [Streptomyces sp. BBFR102]|uniref:class II aldolase/adducin family protein n=1 Tax=Streptomyces sp. BBFR102 TaxID=3448171 RepID=UPI003F5399A7
MKKNVAHPGRAWRLLEDQAVARAWHDLLETARATARDGLVVGTSGNVSVRVTPDRPAVATDDLVLVTPTGVPYDRLGPEDAVAVTLDGRQVLGTLEPTSELPLHLTVHRSGTARAVVHTHAPHATAVSTLVDTLPPVHYLAAAFGGPVRTAPYALYGTQELAGHLREALRDRTACLLRNHGTVTTGDTLAQALDRTAQLEWLCRVWLLARSVPGHTPSLLDEEQLAEVAERLRGYGQPGG